MMIFVSIHNEELSTIVCRNSLEYSLEWQAIVWECNGPITWNPKFLRILGTFTDEGRFLIRIHRCSSTQMGSLDSPTFAGRLFSHTVIVPTTLLMRHRSMSNRSLVHFSSSTKKKSLCALFIMTIIFDVFCPNLNSCIPIVIKRRQHFDLDHISLRAELYVLGPSSSCNQRKSL